MGSLTVRNLGEDIKKRLRLRAAANGRSMEEEVRLLLAERAAETATEAKPRAKPSTKPEPPVRETATRRVLLIISGGIAAYKSLDLIRRVRERRIAVRGVVPQAAEEVVTPLPVAGIAGERPV